MKEKIKENFDKAALGYDKYATIQKKSALKLVSLFCKSSFIANDILDVGCGSGFVTEALMKKFPKSLYTLNDIAPKMVKQAKIKFPNYTYSNEDAETCTFSKEYDLIISNLAFQWFDNLKQGILNLWKQTKCLTFSIPLIGTFASFAKACKKLRIDSRLHSYPAREQIVTMCYALSPIKSYFEEQTEEINFSAAIDFIRYLKRIGANTPKEAIDAIILRKILSEFPNGIIANYKIFHAILIKL